MPSRWLPGSIDTDAHAPGQLEWQVYGCERAADCGVEPDRVINRPARPLAGQPTGVLRTKDRGGFILHIRPYHWPGCRSIVFVAALVLTCCPDRGALSRPAVRRAFSTAAEQATYNVPPQGERAAPLPGGLTTAAVQVDPGLHQLLLPGGGHHQRDRNSWPGTGGRPPRRPGRRPGRRRGDNGRSKVVPAADLTVPTPTFA